MKTAVVESVQDKMLCANGEHKKGIRGLGHDTITCTTTSQEDWDDLTSEAKGLSTKVQVFRGLSIWHATLGQWENSSVPFGVLQDQKAADRLQKDQSIQRLRCIPVWRLKPTKMDRLRSAPGC